MWVQWARSPSGVKFQKFFICFLLFIPIFKIKWPHSDEKAIGVGRFWPQPRGPLLKEILGTPLGTRSPPSPPPPVAPPTGTTVCYQRGPRRRMDLLAQVPKGISCNFGPRNAPKILNLWVTNPREAIKISFKTFFVKLGPFPGAYDPIQLRWLEPPQLSLEPPQL